LKVRKGPIGDSADPISMPRVDDPSSGGNRDLGPV
jgi:hypothetical protein